MKKTIRRFVYQIFLVTALTLLANSFFAIENVGFLKFVWTTHFLLFGITFISFFLLMYIDHRWPTRTGFMFIAMSLVKMTICVFFLFPHIKGEALNPKYLVLNFMSLYFIYLSLETFVLYKYLNNKHIA